MDTKLKITLLVDTAVILAVLALAVQWGRVNERVDRLTLAVEQMRIDQLQPRLNSERLARIEAEISFLRDDVREIKTEVQQNRNGK